MKAGAKVIWTIVTLTLAVTTTACGTFDGAEDCAPYYMNLTDFEVSEAEVGPDQEFQVTWGAEHCTTGDIYTFEFHIAEEGEVLGSHTKVFSMNCDHVGTCQPPGGVQCTTAMDGGMMAIECGGFGKKFELGRKEAVGLAYGWDMTTIQDIEDSVSTDLALTLW